MNVITRDWVRWFDKIFLINLIGRTDRFINATFELRSMGISFDVFKAAQYDDGKIGIYHTMKLLFEYCINSGFKKVLVFEDDPKFLLHHKEFNDIMDCVADQLDSIPWKIFKLGCVPVSPCEKFVFPNILKATRTYGLHACAYTEDAMKHYLSKPMQIPIDVEMFKEIEAAGDCYCAYPLLVTQRTNYSDITKRKQDWDYVISGLYKKNTEHLIKNTND